MTRTYRLRRFTKPNSAEFQAALNVYVTHIEPNTRTNSNEIVMWLERGYREYGDEFCVLGFILDDKVIGFVELAYFRERRVVLFDYLVLHKSYRSRGEYYQFAQMLREWLDDEGFEFDFAAAEVSYGTAGSEPSDNSIRIARLFKRLGMATADCVYHQPVLGADRPQTACRAHLLVGARTRVSVVTPATLVYIVETIFLHHARWYRRVITNDEDFRRYEQSLRGALVAFRTQLVGRSSVALNGVRVVPKAHLPTPPPTRLSLADKYWPVLVATMLVVVCISIVAALTQLLDGAVTKVIVVVASGIVIVATAYALQDRKKRFAVLNAWLRTLTRVFGKDR